MPNPRDNVHRARISPIAPARGRPRPTRAPDPSDARAKNEPSIAPHRAFIPRPHRTAPVTHARDECATSPSPRSRSRSRDIAVPAPPPRSAHARRRIHRATRRLQIKLWTYLDLGRLEGGDAADEGGSEESGHCSRVQEWRPRGEARARRRSDRARVDRVGGRFIGTCRWRTYVVVEM